MKKAKLLLSVVLSLALLLCMLPVGTITANAAFENTYINTGNQRIDIIGVAKTQIGNTNGLKYRSDGASWCAAFVVWCARQADIGSSIIKDTGWATADDLGVTYIGRDASRSVGINYTPSAGDLIFFDWESNGFCYKSPASNYGDHVGIVEYVENGYVHTIEGNSNNSVRRNSYSLLSVNIKGYGIPKYNESAPRTENGSLESSRKNANLVTVAHLKAKYPQDKYWNHMGMSSNNADGYTSTPCSSHTSTSTCNAFVYNGVELGWQCFGFALKLGYDAYGSNPKNWGRAYNLNNIKPGDIINYDGNNPGHTVFVYEVNGDTISIAECNYGGKCRIRWDRKLKKSDFNNLYNVYVAPFALEGGSNIPAECSCSTSWTGQYTTKNVSSSLTIRSGHGTSFSVLGSIPANGKFNVSKADGSWAHITYNGVSGYVSCAYIQRVTNNQIDTRYPTPFKAYCISDGKVPAYDSVNGSTIGNIYGDQDFCEILEVYTNGWVKVNCPWSDYSNGRIVYVPLSTFIYNTSYTPKTATASYKTTAYFTAYRDSSAGYIYAGDVCTVIDEYNGRYCVICPWSIASYTGRYMVWCEGFAHTHSYGGWSNYNSTYHARYCDCGNVDKAVHIWNSGKVTVYPGCEGTGIKTYTCSICGATKTESIPATGHSYDSGTISTAPTCTSTGVITYTCINCGNIKTDTVEKNPNNHSGSPTIIHNKTDATCTTDGYSGDVYWSCCNVFFGSGSIISAPGHIESNWIIDKESTTTETGSRHTECTVCKTIIKTETIAVKEDPVIDENAPQIIVESKKVTPGKEFTISVNIKNNPGFAYLELSPEYSDGLVLVKAENGTLISDFSKGKQYIWSADEDATGDGLLMTFTFTTEKTLKPGNYNISFVVRGCINYNEENVELSVVNGVIEIVDFVYGDANGDGTISGLDVVRLKKYLANYDYDTGTSTVEIFGGADANGDGTISGLDVVRLKKYLANYDYDTGTSTVVLGAQ